MESLKSGSLRPSNPVNRELQRWRRATRQCLSTCSSSHSLHWVRRTGNWPRSFLDARAFSQMLSGKNRHFTEAFCQRTGVPVKRSLVGWKEPGSSSSGAWWGGKNRGPRQAELGGVERTGVPVKRSLVGWKEPGPRQAELGGVERTGVPVKRSLVGWKEPGSPSSGACWGGKNACT